MWLPITRSEEGSQDVAHFRIQIDDKYHNEAFRLFCDGQQYAQRILADGTSVVRICDQYGDPSSELPCNNSTEIIPSFERLLQASIDKHEESFRA